MGKKERGRRLTNPQACLVGEEGEFKVVGVQPGENWVSRRGPDFVGAMAFRSRTGLSPSAFKPRAEAPVGEPSGMQLSSAGLKWAECTFLTCTPRDPEAAAPGPPTLSYEASIHQQEAHRSKVKRTWWMVAEGKRLTPTPNLFLPGNKALLFNWVPCHPGLYHRSWTVQQLGRSCDYWEGHVAKFYPISFKFMVAYCHIQGRPPTSPFWL